MKILFILLVKFYETIGRRQSSVGVKISRNAVAAVVPFLKDEFNPICKTDTSQNIVLNSSPSSQVFSIAMPGLSVTEERGGGRIERGRGQAEAQPA